MDQDWFTVLKFTSVFYFFVLSQIGHDRFTCLQFYNTFIYFLSHAISSVKNVFVANNSWTFWVYRVTGLLQFLYIC